MIKTNEMNSFIKNLKKTYLSSSDISITPDIIYKELCVYGLSNKEKENNYVRDVFGNLENYFRNSNLQVYEDERQKNFLQFRNCNPQSKCIKLYVSFPKEYIETAAIKIFGYIASNNMPTMSKMSQYIRSDSIVIRLINPSDAKLVLNYINSDKDLNRYAKQTNPFSLKEGIVGIGYDAMLSYNDVLSYIMCQYFNDLQKNNYLNYASLDSFANYVSNYHRMFFEDINNQQYFKNTDMFSKTRYRFNNDEEAINNFEQVIRLISCVVNNDINKDKFFTMFEQFGIDNKQNVDKPINNNYEEQINLLNEYINYASKKYGLNDVYLYLQKYMEGNNNAITREMNFRDKFINTIDYNSLRRIVNNNCKEYVNNYTIYNQIDNNYQLFINSCIATLNKYGKLQMLKAIYEAKNGNFAYFTNGIEHYRNQMVEKVNYQMIDKYILFYLQNKKYILDNQDPTPLFADDICSNYSIQVENQQQII